MNSVFKYPGYQGLLTNSYSFPFFLKKKKKKVNSVFKQQGPTDAGFPFIP